MRELHRDYAARLQQYLHACDEIIEVGNVRKDVVTEHEVSLTVFSYVRGSARAAVKADLGPDAALPGYRSNVGGRLDS